MSKIDNSTVHLPSPGSTSSSSDVSAGHGVASRHIKGLSRQPFRQKVGAYLGMKNLRRMMSPLQVSDSDFQPITSRNNEQMITDLSRMLVNLENQGEPSQDKEILKMMIRESVRRIMIVEKQKNIANNQRVA